MTYAHFNTSCVNNKHHVFEHKTFNAPMKSVGERIRQAREFRGLSGQQLAEMVGYKHQSAIGNLENRATGNGGNKIVDIAQALDFSVHWLLDGPDTHDMRTVAPFNSHKVESPTPAYLYTKTVSKPDFSQPRWPFENISIEDYGLLSQRQQGMVEGYIRSLLDDIQQNKSAPSHNTA